MNSLSGLLYGLVYLAVRAIPWGIGLVVIFDWIFELLKGLCGCQN